MGCKYNFSIDESIINSTKYEDPTKKFFGQATDIIKQAGTDAEKFATTLLDNVNDLGLGVINATHSIIGVTPECAQEFKNFCLNEGYTYGSAGYKWCIKGQCFAKFPKSYRICNF